MQHYSINNYVPTNIILGPLNPPPPKKKPLNKKEKEKRKKDKSPYNNKNNPKRKTRPNKNELTNYSTKSLFKKEK